MFSEEQMIKCRGCAAKLAFTPLSSALKKLDLIESSRDDSIEVGTIKI